MTTSAALSQEKLARTAPDSQLTAENLSLEVGEDSFVYRRFGNEQTAAPALVMLQHFRGNLDSWDPALVDRLAQDRELILVNNRGVGGSTGVVPENVTNMARDALAFIDALGLKQIDLLGFSLGGYVAQELVLLRPRLVRRLVLAGTAPQGGPDLHRWSDEVYALATPDEPTAEDLLELFSSGAEQSRAKGRESLGRLYQREVDRDEPTDLATRDAQLAAITAWGIPDASKLNRLAGITQPTLVANGDNDTMMHTQNSHLLAERLPNAELRIYPDAGHGFLNQYPEVFADDAHAFLETTSRRQRSDR
jgi:pimeloyl-ACP methyl ester carboxylesterase